MQERIDTPIIVRDLDHFNLIMTNKVKEKC